jgi:hypothetical protein
MRVFGIVHGPNSLLPLLPALIVGQFPNADLWKKTKNNTHSNCFAMLVLVLPFFSIDTMLE